MNKLNLTLSLSLAPLIACGLAQPRAFAEPATASAPAPSPKPVATARFAKEIDAFEAYDHKTAPPRDAILFVGSSTIRLWESADAFPDLPVINRGFGGSTIDDVNYYADRIVFKYKPRVIVFYSGDNDIASGRSPDRVFNDFRRFADSVHERLPEAKLIYLSIKPSTARWKLWDKAQNVNAQVKRLAQSNKQITYVDTAPSLLNTNGEPTPELFREDGLHMNADGYERWKVLLAPMLKKFAAHP